jgi:Integrase core domain
MPRLCTLDPLTGQVIRSSKATAVRHERDRPGELVHIDVKKIGRIPDGGDWRAHGRENHEDTRDRTNKVGYDYVHSLVDDHSRLAYAEILPDEKGANCAAP